MFFFFNLSLFHFRESNLFQTPHHAATTFSSYQATCIAVVYTCTNRYAPAWATVMGNHTLPINQECVKQIWNGQCYDQKLKGLCQTRLSSPMLSLKMLHEWRYTKLFIMRKAVNMICIFWFFLQLSVNWCLGKPGFSHKLFCQELSEEWNVNMRKPQVL